MLRLHESAPGPGCVKIKILKRDENDILKFDFEIEWACDADTSNGLERLTCSIAIEQARVFTQGPKPRSGNVPLFRRYQGHSRHPGYGAKMTRVTRRRRA